MGEPRGGFLVVSVGALGASLGGELLLPLLLKILLVESCESRRVRHRAVALVVAGLVLA